MSKGMQNPFLDDWRECLLAHYRWLVEQQEHQIAATMRCVLQEAGVPEARFALPEPEPQSPSIALEAQPEPPAATLEAPSEPPAPPAAGAPTESEPPPKPPQPKQLTFF